MALFLDTGDINLVRKFHRMGIINGVTTNPSIMFKAGVTGGMEGIKKRSLEIAELIAPYPLSVEIMNNETREDMIEEAKELAKWADNIVVKVPFHGPNGEMQNIEVIHELENKYNIRVNVTAMMSVQQCLLAAMAGGSYVSLFCGRVNDMGYNSTDEVRKLRKLLDDFNLKAQIIAASTRETINVAEWLHAGAHIVTVAPKPLEGMIVHPYTKETVKMFLDDAQKIRDSL
jgi:transaldolase